MEFIRDNLFLVIVVAVIVAVLLAPKTEGFQAYLPPLSDYSLPYRGTFDTIIPRAKPRALADIPQWDAVAPWYEHQGQGVESTPLTLCNQDCERQVHHLVEHPDYDGIRNECHASCNTNFGEKSNE
jgi:hypothetical protein